MQISGSSAIVVGGAGGLGEATVRRLHAAGAKVVIADLADEKGKALADELDARYVRTDATNTEDVNAALAEAESLGPLRISVDAHGGPASGGRLIGKDGSPLDLDGFKTTIDVYLTGVFNVLRLAAAAIARQEPIDEGARGVIINTASIAAYEGQIGQLPYAAAKGGVVAMTLVAARDLLWAEAFVRQQRGEVWHIDTPELRALCEAEQEERYEVDSWEEAIVRWFNDPTKFSRAPVVEEPGSVFRGLRPFDGSDGVTTADVLEHAIGKLKGNWTNADTQRIGRILRRLKMDRTKTGPKNAREWRYVFSST